MLQDSTILKNLVEMKRLPVLFIGSGFSKRYLINYPTWIELLKEIAELIGLNAVQFEAHIQKIRSLHPDYKNSEIYAELATVLSDLLTTKLINQEINIDKILIQEEKEKYLNGTDCFKLLISKKFLNFEINSELILLVINKKRDIIANSNMRKLMSFYDYLINYNKLH